MKKSRQDKIRELVETYAIETQEELADYLRRAGYQVTQATVSRDIKALQLTKQPGEDGRQRYAFPRQTDAALEEKYIRVLKDGFVSMDTAENLLVMKTVSGMAMAVAAAVDALHMPQVLGCIGGDDTILMVIRTTADTKQVLRRLQEMIEEN